MSNPALSDQSIREVNQHIARKYPIDASLILQPGDTLEFPSFDEFLAFEDTIPRYVDNDPVTVTAWQQRPALKEKIRASKSIGQFGAVLLEAIDTEDFLALLPKNSFTYYKPYHEVQARTYAFSLLAEIRSTGRGVISTAHANVVYAPSRFRNRITRSHEHPRQTVISITKDRDTGAQVYGIRRIIRDVSIENPDALANLKADSRENAVTIEGFNIRRPFRVGSMTPK